MCVWTYNRCLDDFMNIELIIVVFMSYDFFILNIKDKISYNFYLHKISIFVYGAYPQYLYHFIFGGVT